MKIPDNMGTDIRLLGRGLREKKGGQGNILRAGEYLRVRLWVGDKSNIYILLI